MKGGKDGSKRRRKEEENGSERHRRKRGSKREGKLCHYPAITYFIYFSKKRS